MARTIGQREHRCFYKPLSRNGSAIAFSIPYRAMGAPLLASGAQRKVLFLQVSSAQREQRCLLVPFFLLVVMIAAMKRVAANIRALNSMHRMQWLFAVLAIAGCLFSASAVHSHEDGLHALGSHCISCDLEDVTSHGATTAVRQATIPNLAQIEPAAFQRTFFIAVRSSAASIRAPPFYS